MKKILSLLAVAALAGCATQNLTPEQGAIDRVFALDSTYPGNSSSVATLVVSKETTPLEGCPKDFVGAYKDNIAAWKKFAAIEKQMYALDLPKAQSSIKSFLGSYSTDPLKAIIALKAQWPQFGKELDKAFSEIRDSYTAYTNIAANNGVAYPKASSFF